MNRPSCIIITLLKRTHQYLRRGSLRSDCDEEGGEEDEAMEKAVQDGEAEYLEEGLEDVGLGEGEDDHCQEGGYATVEDCRA